MVRDQECQWALTQKQTLWGGGALQRGDRAPLEPLAQLGDALRGVGAAALPIKAAELVVAQAAKGRRSVNGADKKANTQGRRTQARSRRCP